jgi:hypothetical protein
MRESGADQMKLNPYLAFDGRCDVVVSGVTPAARFCHRSMNSPAMLR